MNWGMSDRLGPVNLQALGGRPLFLGREIISSGSSASTRWNDRRRGRRILREQSDRASTCRPTTQQANRPPTGARKEGWTSTRSKPSSANRPRQVTTASRSRFLPPESNPAAASQAMKYRPARECSIASPCTLRSNFYSKPIRGEDHAAVFHPCSAAAYREPGARRGRAPRILVD